MAVLSLAVLAAGIGVSFCSRGEASYQEPLVTEMPELLDSVLIEKNRQERNLRSSKKKNKKKGSSKKSDKNKKTYRQRRPLDEPV